MIQRYFTSLVFENATRIVEHLSSHCYGAGYWASCVYLIHHVSFPLKTAELIDSIYLGPQLNIAFLGVVFTIHALDET